MTATSATASSPDKHLPTSTPAQPPRIQRSNFEDWVGDDDEEYYPENKPKHERGGKKKKKKAKPQEQARIWDWDDVYDPEYPNSFADYKRSEEQNREIRDWKARLYHRQLKKAKKGGAYIGEGGGSRAPNSKIPATRTSKHAYKRLGMFAPPPSLNFAPPPMDNGPARNPQMADDDHVYNYPTAPTDRMDEDGYDAPISFAQSSRPAHPTDDDPYLRRMQMSGMAAPQQFSISTQARSVHTPPVLSSQAAPPMDEKAAADLEAKKADAAAKIAVFKAKIAAHRARSGNATAASPTPPAATAAAEAPALPATYDADHAPPPPPADEPGAIVLRAPVRYDVLPAPSSNPTDSVTDQDAQAPSADDTDQPRSNRPGQKGFAERLLKKFGWDEGQGLGAKGEGITTAIVAKAEKRKKLSDAEGGGWAKPANMGKIVGGKRRKLQPGETEAEAGEDDGTSLAKMSEVVKLIGILAGTDVDWEIQENGLYDKMGQTMQERYGNVERIFVWRPHSGGDNEVFVKFTSQLSALRAVQDVDGQYYAGNLVRAQYWEVERFEKGEYA